MVEEPLKLKLFFSYSHRDEALRDELGNHLKILEHLGLISSWHDRKILAGDGWDHQINTHLETADIILLLISSDFLASSYCWDVEIKRAMARHEAGTACVIPVILRSVDWSGAPFGKLQAVPKNAQPVTSFSDRDVAFQFVTQEIRKTATTILEQRKQQEQQRQKEAAIAQYRQRYQEFLADQTVSFGEDMILQDVQNQLGLTDAEVAAIKSEGLTASDPQRLSQYKHAFEVAIAQHGYPLNDVIRSDLKLIQQHWGLSDGAIASVEALVVAQSGTAPAPHALKPDGLASERGMDYAPLRNLLQQGRWQDADRETSERMCELMGRQQEGWLRIEDIETFPCIDLHTLDALWLTYSDGKFGFSVQNTIFERLDQNDSKFGEQVGWRGKAGLFGGLFAWKRYSELTFDLTAPAGHLPARWIEGDGKGPFLMAALASRLNACHRSG